MRYTKLCMEKMKSIRHKVYCTLQESPEHIFRGHPESPKRLQTLREWLSAPPYPEIEWLEFSEAGEADVMLVHHESMLATLKAESQQGSHEFEPSPSYVTESSYRDALGAAGATLKVSKSVQAESSSRGFAIVRPPGHHADRDFSMGFCLLNNVAIAAADAVASGLSRVAIVDFDAHHGNGTEAIFWNTPQVGFLSTHEMDLYPGSGKLESAPHARGRIVNIPLPAFAGNAAFEQICTQVITPWIANLQPEMIFVSAGFDGHFSDPLTTLTLDTKRYYQITRCLVELAEEWCDGRIVYVLEGGYDPLALKENIQACLAALSDNLDFPDSYGQGPVVNPDIDTLINQLQVLHNLQEK